LLLLLLVHRLWWPCDWRLARGPWLLLLLMLLLLLYWLQWCVSMLQLLFKSPVLLLRLLLLPGMLPVLLNAAYRYLWLSLLQAASLHSSCYKYRLAALIASL
jgi:hypothetical protein